MMVSASCGTTPDHPLDDVAGGLRERLAEQRLAAVRRAQPQRGRRRGGERLVADLLGRGDEGVHRRQLGSSAGSSGSSMAAGAAFGRRLDLQPHLLLLGSGGSAIGGAARAAGMDGSAGCPRSLQSSSSGLSSAAPAAAEAERILARGGRRGAGAPGPGRGGGGAIGAGLARGRLGGPHGAGAHRSHARHRTWRTRAGSHRAGGR